jgi:hypothetical protein
MSKKIQYAIVIASVIPGVAILLVVPSGIVLVVMSVLCLGLALLLIFKWEKGEKHATKK